jgi:hypothetical protein
MLSDLSCLWYAQGCTHARLHTRTHTLTHTPTYLPNHTGMAALLEVAGGWGLGRDVLASAQRAFQDRKARVVAHLQQQAEQGSLTGFKRARCVVRERGSVCVHEGVWKTCRYILPRRLLETKSTCLC